jgi:chemotaxis protein CheZ
MKIQSARTTTASDSDDLQALFDSIAAASGRRLPAPAADADGRFGRVAGLVRQRCRQNRATQRPALRRRRIRTRLFDSVSQAGRRPRRGAGKRSFNRLGHLARQLHDSLRGLGMDKLLEDSARQIPDARQRLAYIAR